MHDDTQIARVVVMGKALRNGQFPVRWVSDLGYGYGYPIFNFYGPLPYYVGGFLYALGFSGLWATKFMMLTGMILPGIVLFLVISRIAGNLIGLVSGLLYVYFPYRAVQLYVRGAIGELWVLVFLPLIIGALYSATVEKKYSRCVLLGALGICGIALSHTILGYTTAVFFCVFVLLLLVIRLIKKRSIKPVFVLGTAFVGGLSLSAFFWLPAIVEMKYTTVSGQIGPTAAVKDHFVCPGQFWYSPWGFGGSVAGCTDGLSFMLGKIHILMMLSGFGGIFFFWRNKEKRMIGLLGLGIVIVSVFFMLDISESIWNILPGFSYVQYPWRFLAYTGLGIAILPVFLLHNIKNRQILLLMTVGIIFATIMINAKLFSPQYMYDRALEDFETETDIKYRASRISNEYLPSSIVRPRDASGIVKYVIPDSESYSFKQVVGKESYKKIEFLSKKEQEIVLQHAHFPGWRYWVNSSEQAIRLDQGRPIVTIPGDFSTLEMKFTDTPARIAGNVISLIGVILLGYYYGKKTIR
jgi:hypothetical protein